MTEFQIWKSQFHKRLIQNNPPTKKPTKVTTPQVTTPQVKTITPPTPKTTPKTNYISKANKSIKKPKYTKYRALDWNTINKMTNEQLYSVVKGLSVGANARLRTIKTNKLDKYSVWYHKFGGKITPSNDRNMLLKQYKEMNKFLNSRLSTVEGIRNEKKRVAKLLGIDVTNLSTDVYQLLSDTQGKMRELHLFGFTYDSEQFFDDVGTLLETAKDLTDDDIVLEIRNKLNNLTDTELVQYKDREWFQW